MRAGGLLVALLAAVALVGLGGADPAAAQAPTTVDAAAQCAKVKPSVIFVGTVTRLVNEVVSFRVERVRSGAGQPGTTVEVEYPTEFNARKLLLGVEYRVAAVDGKDGLLSVVPTAQIRACGQSTRHADGSSIETGALVGVKATLPGLAKRIGIGVLGALVLLILVGRVFDRRSRYR